MFFFAEVERERVLNSPAVSNNMYEPMCVPELSAFIDYTQAPGVLPGEDRKPIPVAPNSSPANVASPTNNNFLHEGKSFINFISHHCISVETI